METAFGWCREVLSELVVVAAVPAAIVSLGLILSAAQKPPVWKGPHDSRSCSVCYAARQQMEEIRQTVQVIPH